MTGARYHGPFRQNVFCGIGRPGQGQRAGHRGTLTVVRGPRVPWSYFLRADTMSQLYTYWEDLSLVIAWRHFMRDPRSYFRHLLAEL